MSKVTTIITGADGKVTKVVQRRTGGCSGCLTILAVALVVAIPAAFFGPLAVLAYVLLGVVVVAGGLRWVIEKVGAHPGMKL